ncbi:MAG TPA: asparagine synthase (glutamine-hydrolyzing) [Bacteroidia bacterium]|jgi:asparagine synthase (glutamine-hydrolysing)
MCGITGIKAFSDKGRTYLDKIGASTACLTSRGPDGDGIFVHNNTALGHRRLSIIDTSNLADQPFTDDTGRYTIVFNGEIFNYPELRNYLTAKGIRFRSQSDTEVLLYMYISEKEKCLEKLDGEFAFAVYDNVTAELFFARDRFGIKPFYYYKDAERFVFASELKALTAFEIPKVIDKSSLQTYFHLNYIPSPYSIFENVFKLEAGNYMLLDHSGQLTQRSYYEINVVAEDSAYPGYEAAKKKLQELLENSVQKRMISDVPLGTFLSGGIDSSIITAIAAKHTGKLNTFSIGYKDEPLFDETYFAELVAKKHNTSHTVFSLGNEDLFANLHNVLDYIDEPFADSSALAVSILSMHTKKHVTVALSGDGADEIFGGYNKHSAELAARNPGMKAKIVQAAYPLLKYLPKSRNTKAGNMARQLAKFAEGSRLSEKERYWSWAKWSGFQPGEIFNAKYASELNINAAEKRKDQILEHISSDYNSVLLTDMKLVLENDMLVKVDRMSMSRSLEVRVPFLDHHLVDFAFSLPHHFKIDKFQRKKILKDAFRTELPIELFNRGKKGFEVPLLKWFRTDLKSMITDDLLSDKFITEQNIFNPGTIKKLKSTLFSSNPDDAVEKTWALIVFQYWWKKHFNS